MLPRSDSSDHGPAAHRALALTGVTDDTSEGPLRAGNVHERIQRAMVRRTKRQVVRREDGEWKPAFLPRTVRPIPTSGR